jgi:hypothetical protein
MSRSSAWCCLAGLVVTAFSQAAGPPASRTDSLGDPLPGGAVARGEKMTPERLRAVRAIEVLERMGTSRSREVLETLASGIPEARVTFEAKAALRRLSMRSQR